MKSEEDKVFEKLKKSPLKTVIDKLFDEQLLTYDYNTMRISVVLCSRSREICKEHNWDISELIEPVNEK